MDIAWPPFLLSRLLATPGIYSSRGHRIGPGKRTVLSACYRDHSKYHPHQGDQEMGRRRRQAGGIA